MDERAHRDDAAQRRRGFTLVELLVVIFIIALLIGLLIPVVSKVRISGHIADTKNWLSQLSGAIERYHSDFRAYPGPIPNMQIWNTTNPPSILTSSSTIALTAVPQTSAPGFDVSAGDLVPGKITMAENLVLGLLGGLTYDGTLFQYNPSQIGMGPMNLNPANPKRYQPYLDATNLSWQNNPYITTPNSRTGRYFDDAAPLTSQTAGGADDSVIPEFVDRFPQAMPILYLRCKLSVDMVPTATATTSLNSVITDDVTATKNPPRYGPYDLSQIIAYTGKGNDGKSYIGVGREVKVGDYAGWSPTVTAPPLPHGLATVLLTSSMQKSPPTGFTYQYPYDAFSYFQNPTTPNTPRQKDGYILISPGRDRTYGTSDDICSFGEVIP